MKLLVPGVDLATIVALNTFKLSAYNLAMFFFKWQVSCILNYSLTEWAMDGQIGVKREREKDGQVGRKKERKMDG